MDAMFMKSENSKTYDPHRLILNLTVNIKLKRIAKYVALSNLSICYTWKIMKKLYENNKFKMSVSKWDDKFELPDGSYLTLKFTQTIAFLFHVFCSYFWEILTSYRKHLTIFWIFFLLYYNFLVFNSILSILKKSELLK